MSSATAEFKWTSDHAAVLRAFEAFERNQQTLARGFDRLEKKTDATAKAVETGWTRAGKAMMSTAQGLIGGGGILMAFNMISDANREALREADEVAKKYDTLFRQFNVQAGLKGLQGEAAKASILRLAERNAVTEDVAVGGAKGLVGAGFSVEAATGAGLNALLRARAATNATGGNADDLETIAGNVAGYLASQGKDATTANLESVLQGGFALRQTGRFELEDLSDLAAQAAGMKGLLSQEEQLAAYGTLRDILPAAESATGLRNVVSRLSTSRVGRTSQQALKQIGLKPEDVDLSGEDFGTVLDRIQGGLQGIPEAQRPGVLKQLFEEAGVPVANQLLSERGGKYVKYREAQRTVGGEYAETVTTAQSGVVAASTRQGVRRARSAEDGAEFEEQFRNELDIQAKNLGESAFNRSIYQKYYDAIRGVGFSQGTAAEMAYGPGLIEGQHRGNLVANARNQTRVDREAVRVEVVNQPAEPPRVNDRPAQALGR